MGGGRIGQAKFLFYPVLVLFRFILRHAWFDLKQKHKNVHFPKIFEFQDFFVPYTLQVMDAFFFKSSRQYI